MIKCFVIESCILFHYIIHIWFLAPALALAIAPWPLAFGPVRWSGPVQFALPTPSPLALVIGTAAPPHLLALGPWPLVLALMLWPLALGMARPNDLSFSAKGRI